MKDWKKLPLSELVNQLEANLDEGLSLEEAAKKLQIFGRNELTEKPTEKGWLRFLRQFQSPLIYILLLASIITFAIGHLSDSCVIFAILIINAAIGASQEGKAAKLLSGLKNLSATRAVVKREGQLHTIPSEEIVPGDCLILSSGDIVPADGILIFANTLLIDESILTGESEAVWKERGSHLFSGTSVLKGKGELLVTSTGKNSELGMIQSLSEEKDPLKTPLEKKIHGLGKKMAIMAVVFFFLILAVGLFKGLGYVELFFAAIAQVVSIIPEGLPVAITIALAIGVQKLATANALVRQLVAVETLGSTTVICSDKTGTLTQNQMQVESVVGDKKALIQAMVHCNDAWIDISGKGSGDPTELALLRFAAGEPTAKRVQEVPFDSVHKYMATLHIDGSVYIKGAVEALSKWIEIPKEAMALELESAAKGLRVLGFAKIIDFPLETPLTQETMEGKALFLGLAFLIDPPRKEASDAIQVCYRAGLKPVMITGDSPVTAKAIAKQIGLLFTDRSVLTGPQIDALSDPELDKKIKELTICARTRPEQKLRLIEAFQKAGEIVAMTGDGVNDAPALSAANVGVAMGMRGSEVARSAAKIVLLDDNFATIVRAIELGRVIYNNLQKLVFYLLSTSLPASLLMFFAVSFYGALPLSAVQILWINIATEGSVTINLVMDPAEGHEMSLSPNQQTNLFDRSDILRMIYLIVTIFGVLAFRFHSLDKQGVSAERLETEIFTLLAMCAWLNALNCRSKIHSIFSVKHLNLHLLYGMTLGVIVQMAAIYFPPFQKLIGTVALPLPVLAELFSYALLVVVLEEIRKIIKNKLFS